MSRLQCAEFKFKDRYDDAVGAPRRERGGRGTEEGFTEEVTFELPLKDGNVR